MRGWDLFRDSTNPAQGAVVTREPLEGYDYDKSKSWTSTLGRIRNISGKAASKAGRKLMKNVSEESLNACLHMMLAQVSQLSHASDDGLVQDPSLLEEMSREDRDSGIGEQLDDAMSELQKQEERKRREEEAR